METYSSLLAICAVNSPVIGQFLAQRPVTRMLGVLFDLHLNKIALYFMSEIRICKACPYDCINIFDIYYFIWVDKWIHNRSYWHQQIWKNVAKQNKIKNYLFSIHDLYLFYFKEQLHIHVYTVYPKKYAHGFCFAVFCYGYTLTDFPISIRLTSPALWQSNDCPSAGKATLMNMDKYFMWIHYERLHNHNKAKHNKTVCIFLGMYIHIWFLMVSVIYCCDFIFVNHISLGRIHAKGCWHHPFILNAKHISNLDR